MPRVALIVGAVGVANSMIISALERRSGIGLRRALGATQGQIRTQFLAESILLAVIGGGGVRAGAAATAVYASAKGWAVVIPVGAWPGGSASAILIGALAGLLPAVRASRLPPTVALRTGWAAHLDISSVTPACRWAGSILRGHEAPMWRS